MQASGSRLRIEVVIEDCALTLTASCRELVENRDMVCMFKLSGSTGPLPCSTTFGMLVDGGVMRIQYDVLMLSLDGRTVGEALRQAEAEMEHFIQPVDFASEQSCSASTIPSSHTREHTYRQVALASASKLSSRTAH